DEPKKVDVTLGDKVTVVYFNVGPEGTKIVEGMQAQMWTAEGSKEIGLVVVAGTVKERGTTVEGKVVAVSKDGKTVTLEQRPTARGEDAPKIDVKITDKTRVAYNGVGPDGARPTEGYYAQVRLEEGSKDKAAQVMFGKPGGERGR